MRAHPLVAAGLALLALATAPPGAEARAGRGVGRGLSLPLPKIGLAPRHWGEDRGGAGIGAMTAAAARVSAGVTSLRPGLIGEAQAAERAPLPAPPKPSAVPAASPAPQPRPWCASGRVTGQGAGFCQIN